MSYFVISFLVGVVLVFLPSTRVFLILLQRTFYAHPLVVWQMALLWGGITSLLFFVSKDLIEKNGHLKFWLLAGVLTIFIVTFVMFVASSPSVVY